MENKIYVIDEKYRKITQEQIAVAMGLVANLKDDNGAVLDQLAKVRGFFDYDRLCEYSRRTMESDAYSERMRQNRI